MFGFRGGAFSYVCLGIVLFPFALAIGGFPFAFLVMFGLFYVAVKSHNVVENSENVVREKLANGKIKMDENFISVAEREFRDALIEEYVQRYYDKWGKCEGASEEMDRTIEQYKKWDRNFIERVWLETYKIKSPDSLDMRLRECFRKRGGKRGIDENGAYIIEPKMDGKLYCFTKDLKLYKYIK